MSQSRIDHTSHNDRNLSIIDHNRSLSQHSHDDDHYSEFPADQFFISPSNKSSTVDIPDPNDILYTDISQQPASQPRHRGNNHTSDYSSHNGSVSLSNLNWDPDIDHNDSLNQYGHRENDHVSRIEIPNDQLFTSQPHIRGHNHASDHSSHNDSVSLSNLKWDHSLSQDHHRDDDHDSHIKNPDNQLFTSHTTSSNLSVGSSQQQSASPQPIVHNPRTIQLPDIIDNMTLSDLSVDSSQLSAINQIIVRDTRKMQRTPNPHPHPLYSKRQISQLNQFILDLREKNPCIYCRESHTHRRDCIVSNGIAATTQLLRTI